jgi:hypothetical protein
MASSRLKFLNNNGIQMSLNINIDKTKHVYMGKDVT